MQGVKRTVFVAGESPQEKEANGCVLVVGMDCSAEVAVDEARALNQRPPWLAHQGAVDQTLGGQPLEDFLYDILWKIVRHYF